MPRITNTRCGRSYYEASEPESAPCDHSNLNSFGAAQGTVREGSRVPMWFVNTLPSHTV